MMSLAYLKQSSRGAITAGLSLISNVRCLAVVAVWVIYAVHCISWHFQYLPVVYHQVLGSQADESGKKNSTTLHQQAWSRYLKPNPQR
ncbi:hypothetical protein CEK26_009064 [Fusarium fujikuroi]|uniref:Uncharacterized protein n=1 Tax=Fusarium fujikuroi TaxID=5127 RepID=A0A5Q3DE71_FUSFU|nr:hypothetical protein CEK27_009082 [Fusarium fujikuroi]QGI82365.1 hypothetical protein CEK25_009094 [Fusarium fujikuroi]QGI95995.1 hypothetical protein CEK26_009064 [Fusarium fujikuroi]VTT62593.1 unnamed protein product [Fusarium fujikuroi]VTT68096.1 unnamed protein product [Fusarium fujikuroi]